MKRFLLLLSLSLLISSMIWSQPWTSQELKSDGPVNFYELKAAYDAYFETHEKVRGTGYKQFERYSWFMEPRVYPSGYLPEKALWEAWERKQELARMKTGGPVADWTPLGPFDTPTDYGSDNRAGSGRINCIAFHPTDPQIMYVGAPSGGVWKTTDGGSSWTTTTDFLPALGVSDLAIHPDHPEIIYMVTGDKDGGNTCPTYSYGILKSTDAGETWQTTGLVHETAQNIRMRRLVILNGDEEVLLTGGSSGLFRSVDGGDSWEKVASGNFFDLEIKPDDLSVVYACTGQAIFKSTDAGVSFVRLENGLPDSGVGRIEMAVTQANPEVLYAVMTNSKSGFKALVKSSDAGASFTTRSTEDQVNIFAYATDGGGDGSGIGWYAIALAVDQQNENILYSGSVNIWKSFDGGQNWTISAHWYGDRGLPYVHADEHTLAVNPQTNVCFSGNDGGFYKTTDKGTTWLDLSDGLSILQIYRMGASATNPERILEGSQDNGTYIYLNGQWNSIMGGDGMECAIDPQNEHIMYASYQNGALHRSVNMGGWTNIRPSSKGSWITPFDISRLSTNVLVAGYEAVYLSVNRGDSWEKISGELAGGSSMNELTLAPSDDRYIYVSQGPNLWMTDNRGQSWEKISDNLPNLSIEYITVAQSEPLKVWVSFSGYEDGEKVYFSENGGSSWVNYSAGLPNVPANCITYKNNSKYSLYAGTDLGVYYRTAEMSEWVPFDDQLPNVIVNEMEINYHVNKIRAATFGRGMWESPIVDDGNWPPAIQLSARAGDGVIRLDWIEAEGRTPEFYQIYRNEEAYATTQTNFFTDEVTNGLVYEYLITAIYPDGESTPTNSVITRGEEPIELPYNQAFDNETHGWLIQNKISGWRWGTGPELALNLLGESKMIATNSAAAYQDNQHAEGYAILPKMNLAHQQNLVLRFDYALRRWQDLDHFYLAYRMPDRPEWTTLLELEPTGRMWKWVEFSMEVPAEILADELELAFYYTDNKGIGYGAAIDNFYLGPETSSTATSEAISRVSLYPNPASQQLNLLLEGWLAESLTVTMSDLAGKTVWEKQLHVNHQSHQETVDVSQLAPGIYQVSIASSRHKQIHRISIL